MRKRDSKSRITREAKEEDWERTPSSVRTVRTPHHCAATVWICWSAGAAWHVTMHSRLYTSLLIDVVELE